ncbi:Hypothetical predicted protein [Podarcis lilfordi]|uniref:Uncharacterized protein n=1 Tax=Podarcis lilfordi TaxID=74358 RepID=A0AA35L5J5_9SAUR|nr:Hypothetical predicted protein [Podarcis lilfordi]
MTLRARPPGMREPFPNKCFVLVKSLERRDDPQGHTSRDEPPAPASGMKNERPLWRFPAPDPRLPPPPSILCVGMAPSRPYLTQKDEPRFPPIKSTSRVIPEPGETLAAPSVPGRPGRSLNARMEEFRGGKDSAWQPPHPGRDWSPDEVFLSQRNSSLHCCGCCQSLPFEFNSQTPRWSR